MQSLLQLHRSLAKLQKKSAPKLHLNIELPGLLSVCISDVVCVYIHTHYLRLYPRTHTQTHTHTHTHTHIHTHTQVVESEEFSLFLLRNHFMTEFFFKKKSGEVNDERNFPLFFSAS